MKTILIAILVALGMTHAIGQSTSGLLNFGEQSVGVATGLDYAILPLVVSYERGVQVGKYAHPLSLGAEVTTPLFAPDLHDLKLKIRGATTLFQKGNYIFRAGISPQVVSTRLKTQDIVSIGTELDLFVGYCNERWNVGLEASYNQVLGSHIRHTDLYRDNIFAGARDGWYRLTASNLRPGLLVSYRISAIDLYLRSGLSKTGHLNDYLFVPTFYMQVGGKYRF